jgi:hypothetical protein
MLFWVVENITAENRRIDGSQDYLIVEFESAQTNYALF